MNTNKNSKLLTTDLTTDLNEFIDALEHAFASEGHPDTEVSIGRVERSKRHPDGTYSIDFLINLNHGPVIPQDEYLVPGAPRLSEEMARRVCAQVGLAVKNVIEIRIRHQITLVAIVGTSQ